MRELALVTGATGFVGAAVARALLTRGHAVRALVRNTSDRSNIAALDIETVEGDLRDEASLQRAVAGCSAVFHVAADYRLWVPDPGELHAANVSGSVALIKAAVAAGVERIVYTSSVAALGIDPSRAPADEATPVSESDMVGEYKRSKFRAERAVLKLAGAGAPVVIVNPSTPIGPRDVRPTPTGRIIVEAASGRMPAFVDTGLNVVHVDDVALGHVLAFERGVIGERYILGGDDLALREILAQVTSLVGRRAPSVRLPHGLVLPLAHLAEIWYRLMPPKTDPMLTVDSVRMSKKHMYFSSAKARRELGYDPRPASAALEDAVHWFITNGHIRGVA
ncbi:MAG: dihydroflavonol-4-reductase [Gammaproteobacteria bacterium]|jgi:dihydroflavonol-4-reductase